jgi:hypothetical protein
MGTCNASWPVAAFGIASATRLKPWWEHFFALEANTMTEGIDEFNYNCTIKNHISSRWCYTSASHLH